MRAPLAPGSGAHAEFRPEVAVEVRDVAEAAFERDVDYFGGLGGEAESGPAEALPEQELVRCDSGDLLKGPEKVERAETRFAGQGGEVVRRVWFVLDGLQDTRDARDRAWTGTAGQAGLAAVQLDGMGREFDAQLLPGGSSGSG